MVVSSSKIIAFLLCVLLLCIGLSYFPGHIFSWDVFGYYLYLPMTFIYHDLGMRDFSVVEGIIAKYQNTVSFYQATQMPSGDWVMRYNIGLAVLYSPFFFIGHLIAVLSGLPADGFSAPYQYSVWGGCILYTFAGIFMLRKSLLFFFNEKIVTLLLVVIVLGTNYTLHSSVYGQGAMTHNFLFTLYAFVLWFTIRWHQTHKMKHAVFLSVVCGLAVIVRPTEIICLLIPIFWGVYNIETFKQKIELLNNNRRQIIFFSIIFSAICFIQLMYNKIYSGSFFYDGHYNPAEGLDLFPPHTINFLFSFRNGWLIYTPVITFSIIGFYFLYKNNKNIFLSVFIYFIITLWIVSSWTIWWYGNCFSQRGIISAYIVLAIPLGYLFKELLSKKGVMKYFVLGSIFFLGILNLFQSWQVANGILFSYRATPKFWLSVFGRTTPLPEEDKFLYMDWPLDGIEKLTNESEFIKTRTWKLGFEASEGHLPAKLNTKFFHSGSSAHIMLGNEAYSPTIEKKYNEITDKYYAWIRVSVWVYPVSDAKKNPANLIATFMHNRESYKYRGRGTDESNCETGKWTKVTFDYLTPEARRSKNDFLSVYIWNEGNGIFFIDDLQVEVFEPKLDPSVF